MTELEIQNLWTIYHVPRHVRAHMEKVAAVTVFIARKLEKKGISVKIAKLKEAALLHDLVKVCDFPKLDLRYFQQPYTREDVAFWEDLIKRYGHLKHVEAAYQILIAYGENEVAAIVRKHRFTCLLDDPPATWEEKLLYYSDKRVKHDTIVSLQERLEDGRKRYFPDGNIPPEEIKIEQKIFALEKELCLQAGLLPETINEKNIIGLEL